VRPPPPLPGTGFVRAVPQSFRRSSSGSLAKFTAIRPRLVLGQQLGRAPTGLVREVDVGERPPVGVAKDEAGVLFVDQPGRRDAAR
jgi:hypothetical protein